MTAEEQVREMILEQFHNMKAFASEIGIPYTTLDSILKRGFSKTSVANMVLIAQALDLDVERLAEGTVALRQDSTFFPSAQEKKLIHQYRKIPISLQKSVLSLVDSIAQVKEEKAQSPAPLLTFPTLDKAVSNQITLPVVGDVAAGLPIDANETSYHDDSILVDSYYKADFALRVCGDSMEPRIPNGSFVLVKRQKSLENGQVGVFWLDGEYSCKKIKLDYDHVSLVSFNKRYSPIVFDEGQYDQVEIEGLVVGCVEL